jgi:hypothetical protein
MNATFDSLPWHDAALLEVSVDRRNAGECDEVRLRVAWPHGEEAALVFRDCYAMTANMNFGIIATERIGSARRDDNDPNLASIRDQWKSLGVPLELLSCYRLEMSSTASVIRIYAKQFEIV